MLNLSVGANNNNDSTHHSDDPSVSAPHDDYGAVTSSVSESEFGQPSLFVRKSIQDTWRMKREERDQREVAKGNGKMTLSANPGSVTHMGPNKNNLSTKKIAGPIGLPSLCAIVQRSWREVFERPRSKTKNRDRPRFFPSMLSILEANAVTSQVKQLQDVYDDEILDDTGNLLPMTDLTREVVSATTADPAVMSVLSILPAGYDWNNAILQMAQSRSRAFLLLDLAAIVRRVVCWKRVYPGITFVHSVSSNGNPKLLQILLTSGVRLVTTTRSDISFAINAKNKIKKAPTKFAQWISDSTSHTSPPDSYIRELLRARISSVTVDGADEVHRIIATISRMQARRGCTSVDDSTLEFVLRLHPSKICTWMEVVDSTLMAVGLYPSHPLSGISFDVRSMDHHVDRCQNFVQQIMERILESQSSIQIHLTGFEDKSTSFPVEWVNWWTFIRHDERVAGISVLCSTALISSAGALCTRIIGVRSTRKDNKQQLYIDDGCYGSLYRTSADLRPIPLGNYKDSIATTTPDISYSSTVWGPTCDGLDRVCRDIPLPRLERDDWLVFPNLGCPGALGTAFNGFEPPDTTYCVLGYFS